MSLRASLAIVCLLPSLFLAAQTPTPASAQQTPTLNSQSNLVLVPALVRDKSGELVFTLNARDFTLTDDGVAQKLHLEGNTGSEPLALVIDIEGGGSALRELAKFASVAPMIDAIVGNIPHKVAVVAFDSSPALVTNFTSDTQSAADGILALIHDDSGDGGAAMLDSIGFSLDLLRRQPPEYRRAILLISETNGDTSKLKLDEAVRLVTESNTTIYSVGFSTGKSEAGGIWKSIKAIPPPGPSCTACLNFMPEIKMIQMALAMAVDGLRRNVPATVAGLTGGEYLQFSDSRSLALDLNTVANHIPNRYILSFQPTLPHPGIHSIALDLPDHADLRVSARSSYWADNPPALATPPQPGDR